jgi:predicted phage terminase large subunit-like protein
MVSPQEAERERARRELARRELVAFAWYTFHGYRPGAVHYLLARMLEQVERYIATGGEEGIGRLMVFMPPRVGKSELVSVRLPAWFLGRNPDARVILSGCTGDLATGFSRQVRDIIRGQAFQRLWGEGSDEAQRDWVQVSQESRAAGAWELERHRGGLLAAGVGGSIIGRGADLAIIDDPFKSRKEAESKARRDEVDTWYRSTLYSRLEDNAAIVLMHQRWHSDDLAGRLIKKMVTDPGADQWVILSLPAIAESWAGEAPLGPPDAPLGPPDDGGMGMGEAGLKAARNGWWRVPDALGRKPGEALWPEKYGVDVLRSIRVNVGGYEWAALYQQRPQRIEGAMIDAYKMVRVGPDQVPSGLREVRYWDLAVSGSARADYIAGARLGKAADGRVYIRHVARMPGPWADAKGRMRSRMLADPASVTQGIEVAGQQGGYYQEFKRDPRLALRAIEPVNPREVGNKEVRAQVWASRIQDGLIYVVDDGSWDVEGFIDECIAFPTGSYDDQVDGVSGAVQMLGGWMGSMDDVPQDTTGTSMWDELGGVPLGMEQLEPWSIGGGL